LILSAVCTILDSEYDKKYKDRASGNIYAPESSTLPLPTEASQPRGSASPLPGQKSQQSSSEANEILVDLHTPIDDFVQHAIRLLRQDEGGEDLHLIIVRATTPQCTLKAVRIAAEIKAKWYRLEACSKGRTLDPLPGSADDLAEELYQYVRDPLAQKESTSSRPTGPVVESSGKQTGPRHPIKLNAPSPNPSRSPSPLSKSPKPFASTPNQLDIYLSKERIDEFGR
jgi:hypothetical protein